MNKKFSFMKRFMILACVLVLGLSSTMTTYAYTFKPGAKRESTPATFYMDTRFDSAYIADFQKAINTWNNAGFGTLFIYGGTKSSISTVYDGINGVSMGNRGLFTPIAVTSAIYYDVSKIIIETDIDVNTAYTFKSSGDSVTKNGYDVQSMFTHELGHALGLGESDVADATMYGSTTQNETKKRSLHTDDINGLRALGY